MKRLLTFDTKGFYTDEEIVPDGTIPDENQYLADIDEEIVFYKPKLVDGQLVEGLTPEELEELNKPTILPPTTEEKVKVLETKSEALELENNMNMMAMTEMFEENIKLQNENTSVMLAVTELFEMVIQLQSAK